MTRSKILFLSALLFIVYATTVPFDFTEAPSLARTMWIPFWDSQHHRRAGLADMVQNIVLFLPLGFFAVISWPRGLRAVGLATLLGAALSASVELLQTMTLSRTSSVTDLIMNSAGALAGATFALIYSARLAAPAERAADRLIARSPELAVLLGLLVVAALVLWAPFVPSLDISKLRSQVRGLIDSGFLDGGLGRMVPDIVLFMGVGVLLGRTTRSLIPRAALPIALGLAIALAAGAELGQLFIVYRHAAKGDLLADLVGGLIGVAIAATPLRNQPVLGLCFAIGLPAARALAPFEIVPLDALLSDIRMERLLPFSELFGNLRLSTFTNVIETAACYSPFGFVLASRGRSARFAFLLASLLAVILEFLQIPIAGRTFDLGEAGLGAFGALAGAWAFHRIFPAAPRSNGGAIAERQAIGHSGPP